MSDHAPPRPRPDAARRQARADRRRRFRTGCVLGVILLAAAALRGAGLDWGEGFLLHPDERFLALVHGALEPATSLREYLDTARSPLNPNNRGYPFFVYGLFPLLTVRALAWCLGPRSPLGFAALDAFGADLAGVALAGRVVSVLADLLSLLLLFAIGRRLHGRTTGVLAAALYAAAVLPIQLAHFSTVDAFANLFVVLAFWLAVRLREAPRWSDDVLFGAASALGAACKLSVAPAFLLGPMAVALRLAAQPGTQADAGDEQTHGAWIRAAAGVNVSVLVALLVFRLAQPYVFVPAREGGAGATSLVADVFLVRLNPEWRDQMRDLRRQMAGEVDLPPVYQWANRAGLAHAWLESVRFGLGWPLGLSAWFAWAWACVGILRRRGGWQRNVLPVAWVAIVFLWNGSQFAVTMRYFLPAYPFLALLAAWGLVRLARTPGSLAGGPRPMARAAGVALAAFVVLATYGWAFAFARVYTRPHTRIAASRWIYQHVPPGAAIATEGTWDDDLPLPLPDHEPPSQRYRMSSLAMSLEDTAEKRALLQEVLDRADYLVLSSNRFYASLSRLPRRWPMSIEYYRALFDGRLGFALAADFTSPPSLGTVWVDDHEAEESFTVYDHPRVFVFRKTAAYDPRETAAILGAVDLARVRRDHAAAVRDPPARFDLPPCREESRASERD